MAALQGTAEGGFKRYRLDEQHGELQSAADEDDAAVGGKAAAQQPHQPVRRLGENLRGGCSYGQDYSAADAANEAVVGSTAGARAGKPHHQCCGYNQARNNSVSE